MTSDSLEDTSLVRLHQNKHLTHLRLGGGSSASSALSPLGLLMLSTILTSEVSALSSVSAIWAKAAPRHRASASCLRSIVT